MKLALTLVAVLLTGLLCFFMVTDGANGSTAVRDYLLVSGPRETGALNLVTAIYLGYRAFDTLGETVVLALAVIGVGVLFVGKR